MAISADELRRYYASLSDEALLELNPNELTPIARACYDDEFSKRGLSAESEDEDADAQLSSTSDEPHGEDEMVCVVEYDYVDEAELAKGLLEGADIPAAIDRDASMIRLLVPPHLAEQALQMLTSTPLSDEELAAQAEAAGSEEEIGEEEIGEDETEEPAH